MLNLSFQKRDVRNIWDALINILQRLLGAEHRSAPGIFNFPFKFLTFPFLKLLQTPI